MIGTYAELQTAVANWLNKSGDTNLTARVPEFIQLAEARFRRKLDDLDQTVAANITITNGVGTLPTDFGGLKVIDGDFGESQIYYSFLAGQIQTNPEVTGTATILYKRDLPALSALSPTNWLLTRAPDAYLFGSLIQAEFFGWNDERLPLIKAALDEILDELMKDSEVRRWSREGLSPRIRRNSGQVTVWSGSVGSDDPGDLAGLL